MDTLNKEEKQISDSGRGFETIKIKKYARGIKPGGKGAYEFSMARDKKSKKGKLAKEEFVRNWKDRKKKHKVWEKDNKESWALVHDEEEKF